MEYDETTTDPSTASDDVPHEHDDKKVITIKALDNNKIMLSSGPSRISLGISSYFLKLYMLRLSCQVALR